MLWRPSDTPWREAVVTFQGKEEKTANWLLAQSVVGTVAEGPPGGGGGACGACGGLLR